MALFATLVGTESVVVRGTVAKMWENEKRLDQLPDVFSIKNTFLLYLSGKCASGYCAMRKPSLNRGGVIINQWTALNYSLWVGTSNKVSRLPCHAHTDDSNKTQTSDFPVAKLT